MQTFYQWNDQLTKLATSRLRGNARKWYDTIKDEFVGWADMKAMLLEIFPSIKKF